MSNEYIQSVITRVIDRQLDEAVGGKALLNKVRKAGAAVKKLTKQGVTIKEADGKYHLCIGWTDDDLGDAAYRVAQKVLGSDIGWNGKVEMCADVSGHGVTTIERV